MSSPQLIFFKFVVVVVVVVCCLLFVVCQIHKTKVNAGMSKKRSKHVEQMEQKRLIHELKRRKQNLKKKGKSRKNKKKHEKTSQQIALERGRRGTSVCVVLVLCSLFVFDLAQSKILIDCQSYIFFFPLFLITKTHPTTARRLLNADTQLRARMLEREKPW